MLTYFVRSQSLGISVFLENVYYADAAAGIIRKINKYTGGRPVDVNDKPMVKPPVDIKVVHPIIQPMADTSSLFPGSIYVIFFFSFSTFK